MRALLALLLASQPPLSLTEAVRAALERAPLVRAAEEEAARAGADLEALRGTALPQATVTGEALRSETFKSISALGVDEVSYTGRAEVTQAVFTFGRLTNRIAAAEAEEAAALAALADARAAVAYRAASAYVAVLAAEAAKEAARADLEAAEALFEAAQARLAAGAGTRLDLAQARAERAAARARLAAAEANRTAAREELAAAMFVPTEGLGRLAEPLPTDAVPVPLAEAESAALANRPELVILGRRHDAAKALAAYERSQIRPRLDLAASASYARHDYITASPFFTGRESSEGFVAATLTWPLFDGGTARARGEAEEAAARALAARRAAAERDAVAEVRRIYAEVEAARYAVRAESEALAAAEEALAMSRVAFEAGRATALDVIEASAARTRAANALAEARRRYHDGLFRLARAAGTDEVIVRPGKGRE